MLSLEWVPHLGGYGVIAEYRVCDLVNPVVIHPRREKRISMKKLDKLGLRGVAPKPASSVSLVLNKLPLLREYLCCTEYDDQTVRMPSALRLTTRDALWMLTLTDPGREARLPVADASLDKALLLMEQLLGVEDCPWQVDPYARPVDKGGKKK